MTKANMWMLLTMQKNLFHGSITSLIIPKSVFRVPKKKPQAYP